LFCKIHTVLLADPWDMQNSDDFEPEKKREFGDLKVDKENGPQHTGESLGQLCKEPCIVDCWNYVKM
jgi:hypothetical protein